MKKAILLACLIVLSACFSGCIQPPPPPPEDLSSFKDCTDDEECLENSIENCEKAFATQETGDEAVSMAMKITVYGLEQGKCKMIIKIEKVETAAEGLGDFIGPLLQGQEMVCMIPPEKLQSMQEISQDSMQEYCSGPLLDLMKQLGGQE